jgi:hypothetical protein
MYEKYELFTFNHWYEDENNRWHHVFVPINNKEIKEFYTEIIAWLYENVDNCLRHSRWRYNETGIDVKLRYERDYIMFTLRWS